MAIRIQRQVISREYDRRTCWVDGCAGAIPGGPPTIVLTITKLPHDGE